MAYGFRAAEPGDSRASADWLVVSPSVSFWPSVATPLMTLSRAGVVLVNTSSQRSGRQLAGNQTGMPRAVDEQGDVRRPVSSATRWSMNGVTALP
jgi:hypothetical protein